jgi:hypothetical protein
MEQVVKTRIGMTEHAWEIARRHAAESGCRSISEWIEWVVLSQQFNAEEAAALMAQRAKRGREKKLSENAKHTVDRPIS